MAAIFVGGIIRWVVDMMIARRKYNDNQKSRIENRGVLLASGLIAGEALMGLVFAGHRLFQRRPRAQPGQKLFTSQPSLHT